MLSLTGRGVVALTHRSVSALSLLSYLYRLADLTARTPQIAPCLTWILSGLEFALCLVLLRGSSTYCGEPVLYYFDHLFQESDREFLDFIEYANLSNPNPVLIPNS